MTSTRKTSFSQIDLAQLAKIHDDKGTATQQFDMHIDEAGIWFHQGGEIKRKELVQLFASVLTCLDDGSYWLITPAERGQITVADAPFYVSTMRVEGKGDDRAVALITSLGDEVVLGSDHRIRVVHDDKGPRPYVNIRGRLDALIARSVYYELAELADKKDGIFFIVSNGIALPLE
jgi:hypothetical protein